MQSVNSIILKIKKGVSFSIASPSKQKHSLAKSCQHSTNHQPSCSFTTHSYSFTPSLPKPKHMLSKSPLGGIILKTVEQTTLISGGQGTYINADICIPSVSITILCKTVSHLHNQPFTVDRQDSFSPKEWLFRSQYVYKRLWTSPQRATCNIYNKGNFLNGWVGCVVDHKSYFVSGYLT